jgi:hypothetical protein
MFRKLFFPIALILIVSMACNMPFFNPPQTEATPAVPPVPPVVASTNAPTSPVPTDTPKVLHIVKPSDTAPAGGTLIYDVESSGTAAEKRAPYGDSYSIDRLERPFQQDMTYIPDLDIVTARVSEDDNWFYVSIKLIGTDPNNSLGINYGVILDTNHDGFGDYIIWAHPQYTTSWDTVNVNIFADKNHDTAGLSPEKSDAPITTDGYETQIFHGGVGDADPDMAWVRMNAGPDAMIQFAFKKSWSGTVFMLGVMSDAGLKDITKLDYVDRFTEEQAGSPVKDKKYYPLKALFAVDNTCQEAFGFKPTGYEPKLCPKEAPPTGQPTGCQNPSQYHDQTSCQAAGCAWKQNGTVVIAVVYYCTYP